MARLARHHTHRAYARTRAWKWGENDPLARVPSRANNQISGFIMYEFKNAAFPFKHPTSCENNRSVFDLDARLLALNDDQLDAWQERMAVCTVDGGLSQEEAEAIAWREIEGQTVQLLGAQVGSEAARPVGCLMRVNAW